LDAAFERGTEYPFDHLMDLVKPKSEDELFRVLGTLVTKGYLHLIYRVESETGGGIGDFASPSEIPKEIHDWRTDRIIPIYDGDVEMIYEREPAHT